MWGQEKVLMADAASIFIYTACHVFHLILNNNNNNNNNNNIKLPLCFTMYYAVEAYR